MDDTIIARVPLFAGLPPELRADLARDLRRVELPTGAILFSEGDHGDHFYIVVSGTVEIVKAAGTPRARLLGVRGPGEFVGEMSLVAFDEMRTATCRIGEAATLPNTPSGPTLMAELTQDKARAACEAWSPEV